LPGHEHDHPAEHAGGRHRGLPGRFDPAERMRIEAISMGGTLL